MSLRMPDTQRIFVGAAPVKSGGRSSCASRALSEAYSGIQRQYKFQTYSRHPMIWRMKPSAELIGTRPARNSFSTRSQTSPGNNRPRLRYGESTECAKCQLSASIASSCGPNIGSTRLMKKSRRSRAPARVVAHTSTGAGQRSCPSLGGRSRFCSS